MKPKPIVLVLRLDVETDGALAADLRQLAWRAQMSVNRLSIALLKASVAAVQAEVEKPCSPSVS